MNDCRDVNIAVIGGGYWGKNLVRNFAELVLRRCAILTRRSWKSIRSSIPV